MQRSWQRKQECKIKSTPLTPSAHFTSTLKGLVEAEKVNGRQLFRVVDRRCECENCKGEGPDLRVPASLPEEHWKVAATAAMTAAAAPRLRAAVLS